MRRRDFLKISSLLSFLGIPALSFGKKQEINKNIVNLSKEKKIGTYASEKIKINSYSPRNRKTGKKYITNIRNIKFLGNNEYEAEIIMGYPLGEGCVYGYSHHHDVIFNLKRKTIRTIKGGSIGRVENKEDIIGSMKNFSQCPIVEWGIEI